MLTGISFLASKMSPLCAHLACSRHCETIFHWGIPGGLAIRTGMAGIAPFCALFCNTPPCPLPLVRPISDADSTTLSLYPISTGSSAIRPSIARNFCRFRCPSAKSNQ